MKIYYRGYVIDRDAWAFDCTVYGKRPERPEMASHRDAQRAMQWIDADVKVSAVYHEYWAGRLPLPA